MPVMRREFALVLLLSAAGAGLVVLAARQAWAQAIFTPPRPLPTQDFSVTGQELVPLASALALAGQVGQVRPAPTGVCGDGQGESGGMGPPGSGGFRGVAPPGQQARPPGPAA